MRELGLHELDVRELELNLHIGDVLLVGDYLLTIVDVEDGEVCFRLDSADDACLAATAPPRK